MTEFRNRFPDYNVLDKRRTPSWNEKTRQAVEKRIREVPERRFFNHREWQTLNAVCDRIVPQPDRPDSPVPIAPFIDRKMAEDLKDGFRRESMPRMQEAWRLGLQGIDREARLRFGGPFHLLPPARQDEILRSIQEGKTSSRVWRRLPAKDFFETRVLHDIIGVYYSHPAAWNEIGFGGPASPRGYVRLGFNLRDPWEAVEVEDE